MVINVVVKEKRKCMQEGALNVSGMQGKREGDRCNIRGGWQASWHMREGGRRHTSKLVPHGERWRAPHFKVGGRRHIQSLIIFHVFSLDH